MDEQTPPAAARPWTRLDWKLVAALALFALGLRLWQVTHTEVAARDSIGFIRHAWQFHQADLSDWRSVLAQSEQHPLYPLCILAVSRIIEPLHHGPTSHLMQLSAQLASTIAAVLLVLPLFALGRTLFDRRAGFFSVVALQCLPVSGRILADGLSESTFLLFAASALYWGVVALRRDSRPWTFALAGLCGGAAYLTRPEGALIVASVGVMLVAGQAIRAWRRPWRVVLLGGTALGLTALLLGGPFVAATGKLTVKPSGLRVFSESVVRAETVSGPLFAVYEPDGDVAPRARVWWGTAILAYEVMKGSFYIGWVAALLGLWWHRQRFRAEPGAWMMLLVCIGVAVALWRVVVLIGYLSDRHTLLILLCATPCAVAGLVTLGEKLAARRPRFAAAPLLLPLVCTLAGLPKTLEALHDNRGGFREAGLWLAEHTQPTDQIYDPLCWAHYWAGRVFLEHTTPPVPHGYQPHGYVVIERAGNDHPRIPAYQLALKLAEHGERVYHWEGKRGRRHAEIDVYRVPLLPTGS